MTSAGVFLGVTMVIIQGTLVMATPLHIAAFNLQVFGATKAAEPSTMSIYSQVSMYICCHVCVFIERKPGIHLSLSEVL